MVGGWLKNNVPEASSLSSQQLSPWVGLRKINVSYWGWEDMTPFTNSSLRWLPGEPSDSGFCAYLEEPQVSGLRANPCTATAHGLICEKATGEIFKRFRTSSLIWRRLILLCLLCRKPQSEFPTVLQEALLAAHQLCQLHQPGHGVHVVQQRPALRWLHCLCHLFPLWPVSGVADWRLCW